MPQVKIMIELGADGWDGSASETLWADKTDAGFVLDNIPFFKKGLCYQDTVEGIEISQGLYRFIKILSKSENSLYRVVFEKEKSSAARILLSKFEAMGCLYATNSMETVDLVAVNIPRATDADVAWKVFEEGKKLEIWEIQEGDDRHE